MKSTERYYRIVSVDSQISHTRSRQAIGRGAASFGHWGLIFGHKRSLVDKPWKCQYLANKSTVDHTLYRNGWAGAHRTVKSK